MITSVFEQTMYSTACLNVTDTCVEMLFSSTEKIPQAF